MPEISVRTRQPTAIHRCGKKDTKRAAWMTLMAIHAADVDSRLIASDYFTRTLLTELPWRFT